MPSLPGIPWWGALLVAVGGAWIAVIATHGVFERDFTLICGIGALLAIAAVKNRSLFTAAVQPALVMFVVACTYLFFGPNNASFDRDSIVIEVAVPFVGQFPAMFWIAVISVIAALIRGWLFHTELSLRGTSTTAATKPDRIGAKLAAKIDAANGFRGASKDDEPAAARRPRRSAGSPAAKSKAAASASKPATSKPATSRAATAGATPRRAVTTEGSSRPSAARAGGARDRTEARRTAAESPQAPLAGLGARTAPDTERRAATPPTAARPVVRPRGARPNTGTDPN